MHRLQSFKVPPLTNVVFLHDGSAQSRPTARRAMQVEQPLQSSASWDSSAALRWGNRSYSCATMRGGAVAGVAASEQTYCWRC